MNLKNIDKYMRVVVQRVKNASVKVNNKIVSKKAGAIKKIAKRLIVKLKKSELERLKKAREVGNQ